MSQITCRVCGAEIELGRDGRSRRRTTCSEACKRLAHRQSTREHARRKRAATPPKPRKPRAKPEKGWHIAAINAAKAIPAIDRLLARCVEDGDGCWVHVDADARGTYASVSVGSVVDGTARKVGAHRLTYEYFIGEIPEGLQLDHVVCQRPPCVNPWHLDPCTAQINILRQARWQKEAS